MRHLTVGVKGLSTLIAVAACVSESCLRLVLKEDRVPVILEQLDGMMLREMQFLAKVPMSIWRILGPLAGCSDVQLRNEALGVVLRSIGYLRGYLQTACSDAQLVPMERVIWTDFLQATLLTMAARGYQKSMT